MPLIEGIAAGIVGGVCWSITGYLSNKTADKKIAFEWAKLLKPAIVGVIVGAIAGSQGLIGQFDLVANATYMVPVTAVIDKFASIVLHLFGK